MGVGGGVSKHPCLPPCGPQTDSGRACVEGERGQGNEGTGAAGVQGTECTLSFAKAPYCSRASGSLKALALGPP